MTVKELITELEALPPEALVVFRHHRDDVGSDDYETVDCFHWDGEAFIDIHAGDEE